MNRQLGFVGLLSGSPSVCSTVGSSNCTSRHRTWFQCQEPRRVFAKNATPQLFMLAASPGNGAETHHVQHRIATVHRKTNETEVSVTVNLDGTGKCNVSTGIGFLDHMLHQISSHGLIDLDVKAVGDYHIDDHHTNEDVGITIGMAIVKALGDKRGIRRFGHFVAPLDEALVEVVMDFSGRPWIEYGLVIPTEKVGKFDTQLVREFYSAIASNAQLTLHIRQHNGINSHHIIEASFKAFARAMRMALEMDPRRMDSVPSSKGVLTDQQGLDEARKGKASERTYSDKPFRLRRRRYKPKTKDNGDGVGVSDSSEMNMEA